MRERECPFERLAVGLSGVDPYIQWFNLDGRPRAANRSIGPVRPTGARPESDSPTFSRFRGRAGGWRCVLGIERLFSTKPGQFFLATPAVDESMQARIPLLLARQIDAAFIGAIRGSRPGGPMDLKRWIAARYRFLRSWGIAGELLVRSIGLLIRASEHPCDRQILSTLSRANVH